MLPWIMMLAQAVPAIVKTIGGTKQMAEGEIGLAGLNRPEYKMPEEVARALTMSQVAYGDPYMPGQGVMTDRAEQQAANAYSQSIEAGNPFAAIANIQGNSQNALQNIGVASANYQAQDMNRLMQMLQTVAGYRDTEFQMNKFAPYAEKSQEYRDMIGAGNKNFYGGLDQIAGAVGNLGSAMLRQQNIASNQQNTNNLLDALNNIGSKYNQPAVGTSTPEDQQTVSDIMDAFNKSNTNSNTADGDVLGQVLGSLKNAGSTGLSSTQFDLLQQIMPILLGQQ